MVGFSFDLEDRGIVGAERTEPAAILAAIDGGARVFLFDTVVSLVTLHYESRRAHLVLPGVRPADVARTATLTTAFLGWWGLGLFVAPRALWRNLRGGVDVTDAYRAYLLARTVAHEERAQVEAAISAEAVAPGAPPELRRERVIELLDRADVDGAWSLVEAEVRHGRKLGRDVDLFRRVLLALRDRGRWGRAALVAGVLRRDHPEEVQGYVGVAATQAETNADRPDGWTEPTPLWLKAVLALGLLVFVVAGAFALKEELARPQARPRRSR